MNAKGSKSARTPKAPKLLPVPEVALDAGTVAVLPNPADAPAPPKPAGRKKKPAPTVAEVPGWAKRAAARDRAAEMAAVPEAAPVAESPTPKKGRASKSKAKPGPKESPAAAPGSLRAIGAAWIDSIRTAGHSKSTVSSYTNDLKVAYEFLGEDTTAGEITEKQIAAFEVSKCVMKLRSGKPKAQPTILKVRRALRLALVWAEQKGLIQKAPYSAA